MKRKVPKLIFAGLTLVTGIAGYLYGTEQHLFENEWLQFNQLQQEELPAATDDSSFFLTYEEPTTVVTLNDNLPAFTALELSLEDGYWQTFTDLDAWNRVGVANAMLHQDFMPREDREDISSVTPTGWKQRKIESGWFYNRCHLIGFQLTGENANWKNLFTGTQQMNQGDMVFYENTIASYLRTTNNHVRYRITPYFNGTELVCRGVQLEAQSIEDDTIQFNVFIFNVQDGYSISYKDGTVFENF